MGKLKVDGKEIEIEGLEHRSGGWASLVMPQWETIGDQEPPEPVSIIIEKAMMPDGGRLEMKAFWASKAKALVDLMAATMPQGLLDHILAELTFRQASSFIVRSEFWDGLIRDVEHVDNHQERHKELHASFSELWADYITHHEDGADEPTMMELMRWSHQQTNTPIEKESEK